MYIRNVRIVHVCAFFCVYQCMFDCMHGCMCVCTNKAYVGMYVRMWIRETSFILYVRMHVQHGCMYARRCETLHATIDR